MNLLCSPGHFRSNKTVVDESEQEFTSSDPKDCDLCLSRLKSGENLMKGRRDADVQIAPQT